MHKFFVALIFAVITQTAAAQQNPIKTDPMAPPNLESNSQKDRLMGIRNFAKAMEEAGFKEVKLSPALIVQAKDQLERPIVLIVDPRTMLAIELKGSHDRETTGSGSPELKQLLPRNKQ
jgi:hypothetical protein